MFAVDLYERQISYTLIRRRAWRLAKVYDMCPYIRYAFAGDLTYVYFSVCVYFHVGFVLLIQCIDSRLLLVKAYFISNKLQHQIHAS